MAEAKDLERELQILESDLRKLEGEYNMYFSGESLRLPWGTRSRVEAAVKRLDRSYIQNYGVRFRFSTLQSRFATFLKLWDRGLRAREEGRPGPFAKRPPEPKKAPMPVHEEDRILFVASFKDPLEETEKLHELYERVRDAREQVGEEHVPFHKFTEIVKSQVDAVKKDGAPEVAVRVAVKDGKLDVTVRGLKGEK